ARRGGALSVHGTGDPVIANNVFERNWAATVGGAFYVEPDAGSIAVDNNTIVRNTSVDGGAFVLAGAGTVRLRNDILAFNTGGLARSNGAEVTADVSTSCLFGNGAFDVLNVPAPDPAAGNLTV